MWKLSFSEITAKKYMCVSDLYPWKRITVQRMGFCGYGPQAGNPSISYFGLNGGNHAEKLDPFSRAPDYG